MSTSQNSRRNFVRQYQTRRWRDDVGVHQLVAGAVEARARDQLWATTSMKPRKAMTSTKVPSSAQISGQSLAP